MDRQKGLVEYIYKLINSNFRYRKYKIHDKSFVVHFVYNLFYSKSRIPLADDVKVFIQVVILYYFKYFENSNFIIIYNKILDGMCEFYDTSVAKRK